MPVIVPSAMSSCTWFSCETRSVGHFGGDLAEPDAAGGDVEDAVLAAGERALLDRLDRLEDRDVDLLQGAREDVRAEEGLVGVDADAPDVALVRGGERAEAALARDLEHDRGAARDLGEADLLALRLVDEVLGVPVQRRDARIRRLGAGLEAGDVPVDGRDLLAADGADRRVRAAGLLHDQPARYPTR